MCYNQKHNFVT